MNTQCNHCKLLSPLPAALAYTCTRHPVSALPPAALAPAPPAPRQLSNFPTSRKADKSKSWQVGKLAHTTPPAPAPAASFSLTPPVDLTRLNPPLPAALAYTCTHPISARRCCRIVHTSSHPRLSVFSPPERSPPLPRLTPGVNQETTRTPPVRW